MQLFKSVLLAYSGKDRKFKFSKEKSNFATVSYRRLVRARSLNEVYVTNVLHTARISTLMSVCLGSDVFRSQ